jgi:YgiT-type zinc finger domain-containing protein
MKCHVCGTPMTRVVTDLPFRVDRSVMIILRGLPLVECSECGAYALEDVVMERVHEIVQRLRSPSHLDAVLYGGSPVLYGERSSQA